MDLSIPFADLRRPGVLNLGASLNPTLLRTDLYWQDVLRDGWGEFDAMVNLIRARGIKPVLILNGPRGWTCWETVQQRRDFAAWAKEAAMRFGDRVFAWQVANELNNRGDNAGGGKGMPIPKAADLVKRTYDAVRSVSGRLVVLGGICPIQDGQPGAAVPYVRALYDAECKGYFDAMACHVYSTSKLAPYAGDWMTMLRIRDVMAEFGDDSNVWLAELGAPTAGPGAVATEQFQADLLRSALASRPDWLKRIFWFTAQDNPAINPVVSNQGSWGAFRADGSDKPVVAVIRQS